MNTRFTNSPDHIRIAYDVNGTGPAIMLLHGGNGSRMDWHTNGYVLRLQDKFTVITVDLRGHGESDKPTDSTYYTTEKMGQDILAVADACKLEHFILCGFSFGGNVGRYLAASSDRVTKMVMLGNRLSGVSDEHRQFVFDFRTRWEPVVETARGGTFDPKSLPQKDLEDIGQLSFPGELLPSVLAWTVAMLDWETVTPADLRCPTLWLIGSNNEKAVESFKEFEKEISGSNVQVRLLEGLNHAQEFSEIDQVLPVILTFINQGS
jgi:pimeloyl-ACP methyl ester carboxylesterase